MEIQRHIAQGFGKGELYDVLTGLDNQSQVLPYSGLTYYVSKYGNNTTGLSWANAFTTIAAAISASNTYIAITANANGRNRIYIDGGLDSGTHWWVETLNVFPNYCDMIGIGNAGDLGTPVMIYGATDITTYAFGCHLYNLAFYGSGAGVPIVKMAATYNGLEFHNCMFRNKSGNNASIGLQIGTALNFKVNHCQIIGYPSPVIGIQLDKDPTFGQITDNFITATTTGINIAAEVVTHDYQLLIKDNVICRSDPTGGALMAVGIDLKQTTTGSHAMIIHNWIAATDAIHYVNVEQYPNYRDHMMCIDNHIVEGNVANVESDEHETSL